MPSPAFLCLIRRCLSERIEMKRIEGSSEKSKTISLHRHNDGHGKQISRSNRKADAALW